MPQPPEPNDDGEPEDQLAHEAEDLMRQRRFQDAVKSYAELSAQSPGDLWAGLGRISALECAGRIEEAVNLLEDTAKRHQASAHLQRFRQLFFIRREDHQAAQVSQRALQGGVLHDEPDDQLADLYFNQGRYHEARSELDRLLASGLPDQVLRGGVLARLGACLRQLGEAEAACERLNEALAIDPASHWALSELAEAERSLGERAAARRHYHEALRLEPDDHWTRGHLAQLEAEDGRNDRAVALYEEVLRVEPEAHWAKIELAQLVTEQDAAWSRDLCQQVLAADERNPWANAQLGALARKVGKHDEARTHYLKALTGSPEAPWLLHELADTCRHLGRMEEAYATLDRAEAAEPYHAATYGYRADFLRGENRIPAALANLGRAVDLDPDYAWAWRELAELRALSNDPAGADVACTKAIELDGDAAVGDGLRAFLLRCRGERERALPWLERALDRQSDYPWAWRELVESLLMLDHPERAEEAARRGIAAVPGHVPLLGMRAEALRRLGQRNEALAQVNAALELDTQVPQLWALKAELLAELRDLDGALIAGRLAISLPGGDDLRPLLAQILVAAERDAEAREVLAPVLAGNDPIPLSWDLAAHLAERAGDPIGALALIDRAFAAGHDSEPRLLVRRARLLAASDPVQAISLIDRALVADDGPGPWREAAQVAAGLGSRACARSAAQRCVAMASPGSESARAWLTMAETELALGDLVAAADAANRAVVADADLAAARILVAVLADQRGDTVAARDALDELERRTSAAGPIAADLLPVVLRQQAHHFERHDNLPAATTAWERIAALADTSPTVHAERAAFLFRSGRIDEATAVARQLRIATDSPEHQRLVRDQALAAARLHGPQAGLDAMVAHQAELLGDNLALAAQLALAAGDSATAARLAGDLAQIEPGRRSRLLIARTALAERDPAAAVLQARAQLELQPDDDEAAALLGEALAWQGRFRAGLDVLEDPRLPIRPGPERALVAAILAGELHGELALLGRLGRCGTLDADVPLVRVLAMAYPGALVCVGTPEPAQVEDLHSVPPFPRSARILMKALARSHHGGLATALALAVSAGCPAGMPGRPGLVRSAIIALLCRGRFSAAWEVLRIGGWFARTS